MTLRTYTRGTRTFVVRLSNAPPLLAKDVAVCTVDDVTERGHEVAIPGIDEIASTSEGRTYSLACALIDQWLGAQSQAPGRPRRGV
jgi:hypothetical protein